MSVKLLSARINEKYHRDMKSLLASNGMTIQQWLELKVFQDTGRYEEARSVKELIKVIKKNGTTFALQTDRFQTFVPSKENQAVGWKSDIYPTGLPFFVVTEDQLPKGVGYEEVIKRERRILGDENLTEFLVTDQHYDEPASPMVLYFWNSYPGGFQYNVRQFEIDAPKLFVDKTSVPIIGYDSTIDNS